MEPSRIETYKGHEIRISVLPPVGADATYRATYEVRSDRNGHVSTGVIAGAFMTAEEAEEGALNAATHSIEMK